MYLTAGIGMGGTEAIERCSTKTVRKCLPEGTNPIQIIGDPDSQLPGKWSSTVFDFQIFPINPSLGNHCSLLAFIMWNGGLKVSVFVFFASFSTTFDLEDTNL